MPTLAIFAVAFSSAQALASQSTEPVVEWITPEGVASQATQSQLLAGDQPAGYVVPGQTFTALEAEGPDGGSTAYTAEDAYFEVACYNSDYGFYRYDTPTLPSYTVPADPQDPPLIDTMPTEFVTDTVTVPSGCGTSTGALSGGPDGQLIYCETTPGYWGSTNTCGGSVYISVVSDSSELPSVPAALSSSGTITLYTVVSSSQWSSIQSTGHFSESSNAGVYFYNDISSADSAYNLYAATYGAGYRIVQASIGADSLVVEDNGFIENIEGMAYYYIASNIVPLFSDILSVTG